jgi:glycosyltransferase involved in cell wall biosynthesis
MSAKSPSVSVVIPTYNRENLVGRAIKSVFSQTYGDFELIVVDDASKDNTREVIKSFDDKRIMYICHKENRGAPATRNTGIRIARGVYIGLLDDDDEWLPTKLEEQITKFGDVSPKVGLIYSGLEVRGADGHTIETIYYPKYRGDVRVRLLLGTTIGSPTPLIRAECFKKAGLFDESLKSCQDWDMWKRISERYEFDFVPEILSRTYLHENQISSNFTSLIPGRTRMVEKHMEEFSRHPDILVVHLKRLGKLHCINGTYREAVHWFREALKVNFLEIIKIIAWCVIELPRVKFFSRTKDFKHYRI